MNKITLKAYAVKHKLSIFNVMKMVKSHKLKSEEVEVNGKKVLYILLEDETEKEVRDGIVAIKDKVSKVTLEQEVEVLKKEVQALRLELEVLKRKV